MSQRITVEIQNEDGDLIERCEDLTIALDLLDAGVNGTECLRFIDPYGDTTFNQLQLPVLLSEVQLVGAKLPADLKLRVRLFTQFLARAQSVHTYVRFIGD